MKHLITTCVLLLAVGSVAGCRSNTGRIKSDTEGDLVGNRDAGAATYNQIIEEGVQKLLQSHSAAHDGTTRMTLATLGFENEGIEELGDWSAQLYDLIVTSINRSGRYRTVSRRMVDRALVEGNLRQDDLFLPKHRREFVAILEASDNPVQLLLFPRLTTGSTQGGGKTDQRDYMLTLELVDVATGWDDRFASRVRKEYKRR